jgi:hypothetical protein
MLVTSIDHSYTPAHETNKLSKFLFKGPEIYNCIYVVIYNGCYPELPENACMRTKERASRARLAGTSEETIRYNEFIINESIE